MSTDRTIDLCLASAHFFPTHGGAQLRYLRYIPGLRARGILIRVLTGTPKLKKNALSQPAAISMSAGASEPLSEEIPEGTPIQRIPLPATAGWRRSIAFNQALLRFCRQPGYHPQVLQLVSSLQPRSIFWLPQMRRLGAALVYAYTLPLKLPATPIKRAIRRQTLRLLFDQMDCIIVNSPQMQAQLRDLGVAARLEFISNGVDLTRFRPARDADERRSARRSLGIVDDRQKIITTVGAVHPRKGSDLLLEAWVHLADRFPEAQVFIVGLRKDLSYPKLADFRQRIQHLAAASGAAERIHFPGLVRNVETYLRASDVFVFPSQREGMPNVVLEAMATGLPVLLTPFVGLAEDFGQAGREYLLAPRDAQAIAVNLADLLESDRLRSELGEQARKWVRDHLSIETSLDRYASLYYELAAKAPNGARV
ncbi:MAG: glycosyltransferase family 4 protein [Desulfobacterales bacterium]|nr:glycosyltransferase family 4 protein [Desulfobacterales bacterium]